MTRTKKSFIYIVIENIRDLEKRLEPIIYLFNITANITA